MNEKVSAQPVKKILFVDEPYMEGDSQRNIRSRFLWEILSSDYDADLLLLKSSVFKEKPVPAHFGYDKLYSLSIETCNKLYPASYHQLAKGQKDRFINILDSKRYEMVVLAGLGCLPLAYIVGKTLHSCVVVMDIDRLFIPELQAAWKDKQSLDNISKLWLLTQQKIWDRFMLSPHLRCLLSDVVYIPYLSHNTRIKAENLFYSPLPFQPSQPLLGMQPKADETCKTILYWGNPDSPTDYEAAKTIVADIYPRISKKLVEKDIRVVLCGSESYQTISGGRINFAPITELDSLLVDALCVLLPLTEPDSSGRIFRIAEAGKALVCTPTAIASIPLPEGCCFPEPDAEAIAKRIISLLRTPKEMDKAADNLHRHCLETYSRGAITSSILAQLTKWTVAHDKQ